MPDSFVAYDEAAKPKDSFVPYEAANPGGYEKGASESRIGHHLEAHPIKVVPSLIDLAASPLAAIWGLSSAPMTGNLGPIGAAISDWAKGDRANGYPPGEMSVNPASEAYSNLIAALGSIPGTPRVATTIPRTMREAFGGAPTPPPPPSGTNPGIVAPPGGSTGFLTRPGTGQAIGGAGELIGGGTATLTGHPFMGLPMAIRGWADLQKGLAKRAASRTPESPPGPSPSWSRGTANAPPVEAPPTIEGKVIPKEAIEAEIAKYTKPSTVEPPPSEPTPVTTKELAPLPANTRETSRSVYKMAYDEFGEGQSKAGLEKVVENLFGKDRTTAYSEKGLKEAIDKGKTPLTTSEWNTLHRHMEKLYKPSVPKPPQ